MIAGSPSSNQLSDSALLWRIVKGDIELDNYLSLFL